MANIPASRAILINERQRKNPIITGNLIKSVEFEFNANIVPDFVFGPTSCALFLSMKYHLLKPAYINKRIDDLKNTFRLRILLCLVDQEDNIPLLLDLNHLAVSRNFTLILAWSWEEAARYLQTYKAFENKPPTSIKEKISGDVLSRAQDVLCTISAVNKTDVVTLLSNFGSVEGICAASMKEMALCPGLGDKKVANLYDTLHQPFLTKKEN